MPPAGTLQSAPPAQYPPQRLVLCGVAIGLVLALLLAGALRRTSRFERRAAQLAARLATERDVAAERVRLAGEIHDTLLQSFVGVAMRLGAVRHAMLAPPSTDPALTAAPPVAPASELVAPPAGLPVAAIDEVLGLAYQALRDARHAVWDLRAPALEHQDLTAAVAEVAHDGAAAGGFVARVDVCGTPRALPAPLDANLLRIAQEAVANAVRHADARELSVDLRFETAAVTLVVRDDGRGFAPAPPAAVRPASGGRWGLVGMRERAERVGGRLVVRSAPGRGTEVRVTVPAA